MAIIKYAEANFTTKEIHDISKISSNANILNRLTNPDLTSDEDEVQNRFKKFAAHLKKVSPKASDFLYFSTIMLCSAERCLVDDQGNPLMDKNGKEITAEWEINEKTGSWKWKCSDASIKPRKNNNGET